MRSAELYGRAVKVMPAGVSSPVRAYKPAPLFISRGSGADIFDADGRQYTDFCMAFGPLVLGHADPDVMAAVEDRLRNGALYGAPTELEVEYAELLSRLYPSMGMTRFCSSGTEATMHAVRLARGATGRRILIKTDGGFHGSHDSVLVRSGSGSLTHGAPDSLGVPEETARNTVVVEYNDAGALRSAIKANGDDVAAFIVEPVLGNIGPVPPAGDYLREVREITEEAGVLLIFDEVITGFRLAMGGAQERYGVRPDITTLGKIAGGGLPIGVFGASAELMSNVSPLGKVYQGGTFSGNPVSLAAGMATVTKLRSMGHERLDAAGEAMRKGLREAFDEAGVPCQAQGAGSMFQTFLAPEPVTSKATAMRSDAARFMRLHSELLKRGVYLPPSQYETCFVSTAHDRARIESALEAYRDALRSIS